MSPHACRLKRPLRLVAVVGVFLVEPSSALLGLRIWNEREVLSNNGAGSGGDADVKDMGVGPGVVAPPTTSSQDQNYSSGCMCASAESTLLLDEVTRKLELTKRELARTQDRLAKAEGELKTCQTLRGEEADPHLVVLAINSTHVLRTGADAAWALKTWSVRGSQLGLYAAVELASRGYELCSPCMHAAYQYATPRAAAAYDSFVRELASSVRRAKDELERRKLWTAEHDAAVVAFTARAALYGNRALGAGMQGLVAARHAALRLRTFGESSIRSLYEAVRCVAAALASLPTIASEVGRSLVAMAVATVHTLREIGVELIEALAPEYIAGHADVLVTAFLGAIVWQLLLGVGSVVRRPTAWFVRSAWSLVRALVVGAVAVPSAASALLALLSCTTSTLLRLPLVPFETAAAAVRHLYASTVVVTYRRMSGMPRWRSAETTAQVVATTVAAATAPATAPTSAETDESEAPDHEPCSEHVARPAADKASVSIIGWASPASSSNAILSPCPAPVAASSTIPALECAAKVPPSAAKKPSWTSWFPDSPLPTLALRVATATGRVTTPDAVPHASSAVDMKTPTHTSSTSSKLFLSTSPTTVATPPGSSPTSASPSAPTTSAHKKATQQTPQEKSLPFGDELKRRASTGGLDTKQPASDEGSSGGGTPRTQRGRLPFGAELLRRASQITSPKRAGSAVPSVSPAPTPMGSSVRPSAGEASPSLGSAELGRPRPKLGFDASALLKRSSSLRKASAAAASGRAVGTPMRRPALAFDAGALRLRSSSLRKTPRSGDEGTDGGSSTAPFGAGRPRSASAPSMGMYGELHRRMASIRHASSREEETNDTDSDDDGAFD